MQDAITAFAQSVERRSSPTEKFAAEIKAIDDVLPIAYDLFQDWDAATHMTRTEWRTTCDTEWHRTFLFQDPSRLRPGAGSADITIGCGVVGVSGQ